MPAVRFESHYPDGEVLSHLDRAPTWALEAAAEAFVQNCGEFEPGAFMVVLVQQRHKYTNARRWRWFFWASQKGYRVGFRTDANGGVTAAYLEAAD